MLFISFDEVSCWPNTLQELDCDELLKNFQMLFDTEKFSEKGVSKETILHSLFRPSEERKALLLAKHVLLAEAYYETTHSLLH